MNKQIGLWLLCLVTGVSLAQQSKADSLLVRLKTAHEDTVKLDILLTLVENTPDDEWPGYNEQAFNLSRKLTQNKNQIIATKGWKALALTDDNYGFLYNNAGEPLKALKSFEESLKIRESLLAKTTSPPAIKELKQGIANAIFNLGYTYNNQADLQKALGYYVKSLPLYEEAGDKKGLARSLQSIGVIHNSQGNIPKALEYYSKGLKIQEEINHQPGIALSLNNIGLIYKNQGDTIKALQYYQRSLKVWESIGYKQGIAYLLNNIGHIYNSRGDTARALSCYNRSLKIQEEAGDKRGMAYAHSFIGSVYHNKGNSAPALDHYQQSLQLYRGAGNKEGIAGSQNKLGQLYYTEKKYKLAFSYADSSLVLSKEIGIPTLIADASRALSRIDSAMGNYAGAYTHFVQFIIYKDSINNDNTRKASIKDQLKYEFDKKEAVLKEQQEKERIIAREKTRIQKIIIGAVIFGLLLVVAFALYIYRSLKTTRKQKHIIEEKQKEIIDSINYARRIQRSLLPTLKYIDNTLSRLSGKSDQKL